MVIGWSYNDTECYFMSRWQINLTCYFEYKCCHEIKSVIHCQGNTEKKRKYFQLCKYCIKLFRLVIPFHIHFLSINSNSKGQPAWCVAMPVRSSTSLCLWRYLHKFLVCLGCHTQCFPRNTRWYISISELLISIHSYKVKSLHLLVFGSVTLWNNSKNALLKRIVDW